MALWTNIDNEAGKPKNLTQAEKDITLGVDLGEAQNASNRAKGIATPGWVKYNTYTDQNGAVRNKVEVLCALKTITGDNDDIPPNPVITIATQPAASSVTTPDSGVFTVVAETDRDPVPLTFQWSVSTDAGVTFTEVTGATTATLTVEDGDAEYVTGNEFRVVVSAAGADPVTSDAATLTIA